VSKSNAKPILQSGRETDTPANGDEQDSRFGPLVQPDKITFRLWAPSLEALDLLIEGQTPIAMEHAEDGFFAVAVAGVGEGTRYKFRTGGHIFPDLASRQQDGDADGWSIVREPFPPSGRQNALRPWNETVICEVHIGTVSPEGTFAGLRQRLEHFREAGYTCLEIMPVNEFTGDRNWGYDGTLIFAPEASYGTPEELRALVDRAHELGICMVLDVVYNHFGEVDNFVTHYAPEWFNLKVTTPWGPGIDFNHAMVRKFYYENAVMWLTEYDFDGLRFDSVHEIKTESRDRFLGELAQAARLAKPHAKLILENVENSARWLDRNDQNEPMTYVAQWNDDMHHVLDFIVTCEGTRTGYDDPSKDAYADLEKALVDGFIHDPGEGENSDGRTRGGPGGNLPPDAFITYLQNHDQIGNRADSKRLSERTSPKKLDFAHFVKFLAPQIPLCFMGDEGNLSTGFPFFVDLSGTDAAPKREDRYKQMKEMFNETVADGALPDPNDPKTFEQAKLRWHEYDDMSRRRSALERFRELGRWRQEKVWPLTATPCVDAKSFRIGNCLIVNWVFQSGTLTMALNPTDRPHDLHCRITDNPVSTGQFSQHHEILRLGDWSAVAW
jgi:maltooligosyltrehalose trehalohydrolase